MGTRVSDRSGRRPNVGQARDSAKSTAGDVPGSPTAERLGQPKWRDGRLVLGVVLVLVSVLLGARAVGGAKQGRAVLATTRPLIAGHVLAPGDLEVRSIRFSGVTDRYWTDRDIAGLAGHPLLTSVGSGELLARSAVAAVAEPKPSRVVSLPVDPARLPLLRTGNRVDVFATYAAAAGSAGSAGHTDVVLRGVEYLGGGDVGSGTVVAVRLRVPVDRAAEVVRASQVAKLDVVLQEAAGDDAGDVAASSAGGTVRPTSPSSGPGTSGGST